MIKLLLDRGARLDDADEADAEVFTRLQLLLQKAPPLHRLVASTRLENDAGRVFGEKARDVLGAAQVYDALNHRDILRARTPARVARAALRVLA